MKKLYLFGNQKMNFNKREELSEYLKDLAENVYDDAENAEKLQEIIDRINGGDDDEE